MVFSTMELIRMVFFALYMGLIYGVDIFEQQFPRLQCFHKRNGTGCRGTLIENYPNVSRSNDNGTAADTYFFLFTRENPRDPEFLHECGGRLPENTNFDSSHPTEIFINGFQDAVCRSLDMREMKDQLLIRGEYNVILVDWSWGNAIDYFESIANTKIVARQLAIVINNIKKQKHIGSSNFHVIGHSLGAHIAGMTGQFATVRRVTGLDPAGPGFIGKPNNVKLDRDDARLVDVMHTGSGPCLPFLGDPNPLGDEDFYPNGGSIQISCYTNAIEKLFKGDVILGVNQILEPNLCFHDMTLQYYKVSINPGNCEFVGVECDDYQDFESGNCHSCNQDGSNCSVMGMDWELYYRKRDNGIHKYYLDTTLTCPYCDNSDLNLNGFPPST